MAAVHDPATAMPHTPSAQATWIAANACLTLPFDVYSDQPLFPADVSPIRAAWMAVMGDPGKVKVRAMIFTINDGRLTTAPKVATRIGGAAFVQTPEEAMNTVDWLRTELAAGEQVEPEPLAGMMARAALVATVTVLNTFAVNATRQAVAR